MGASLPPSRGRSSRRRSFQPISGINVTPMVDVLLVLLVIFMVCAPLMNNAVPVELPSSSAPALQEKEEPVMVTMTKNHALFVGETEIKATGLEERLRALTHNNPETRIYLRADQELSYGVVMETMGRIRDAGYIKVALVSEPPKPSRGAKSR